MAIPVVIRKPATLGLNLVIVVKVPSPTLSKEVGGVFLVLSDDAYLSNKPFYIGYPQGGYPAQGGYPTQGGYPQQPNFQQGGNYGGGY